MRTEPPSGASRRWRAAAVAAALLALPLAAGPAGAAQPSGASPGEEAALAIEERFMCHCGCTDLTVRVCNCGVAAGIKDDIRSRLSAGQTQDEVEAAYIAQYGEKILSAPIRRGFNLMAWIMPFAAVFAAGAMVVVLVRRWGRHPAVAAPPGAAAPGPDAAALERVDRAVRDLL